MCIRVLPSLAPLFALAMAALTACTTTPDVYTSTAPGADLSNIRTYGFIAMASTDKAQYESLETNFLKVAVAQQLDLRGLRYDPQNPDVLMNFFINTEEKVRSRQVPAAGGYYAYRDPLYDDFAYDPVVYETRIEQFTVGTLTIDMIDPRQRKLIWEGSVTGRLTKSDVRNLEATIDEAVKDIFTQFPVNYTGFGTESK